MCTNTLASVVKIAAAVCSIALLLPTKLCLAAVARAALPAASSDICQIKSGRLKLVFFDPRILAHVSDRANDDCHKVEYHPGHLSCLFAR